MTIAIIISLIFLAALIIIAVGAFTITRNKRDFAAQRRELLRAQQDLNAIYRSRDRADMEEAIQVLKDRINEIHRTQSGGAR